MRNRSILAALLVAALLIPACTKHRIPAWHEGGSQNSGENHGGNNNGGNQGQNGGQNGGENGGQQQGLTLNLRTDWSIRYEGRELYQEADGSYSDVEHFSLSCPGAEYFMVRVLSKSELQDVYNGELKKYFEAEEGYIASDAEYFGCQFNELDYIYSPLTTDGIFLDRSRSGEYYFYLVGVKKDGKLSGDYAATTQVFEQEVPSPAYKAWLGEWLISNGEVGYRISISQSEANWLYRVDGWETGSSIASNGTQMNLEYIETRFNDDGSMSFFSQYLGGYDDDNWGWLDEYFLGNCYDRDGRFGIIDTGLEIGVARFEEGSTAVATLTGSPVVVGENNWHTTFESMCYWSYCDSAQNEADKWLPYNENIPGFPLTLTSTKSSGSVEMASDRVVNARTIHINQPSIHTKSVSKSSVVRASKVR